MDTLTADIPNVELVSKTLLKALLVAVIGAVIRAGNPPIALLRSWLTKLF